MQRVDTKSVVRQALICNEQPSSVNKIYEASTMNALVYKHIFYIPVGYEPMSVKLNAS